MTARPDWGHGPNAPVLTFTEDEIRKVWETHYPEYSGYTDDPIDCACGAKEVNRDRCLYCRAPIPDNHRLTKHKIGCRTLELNDSDLGVTTFRTPEFTVDHFIEQLKEVRHADHG